MNHREPPHQRFGVREALRCLSLLLIPALAVEKSGASPRPRYAQQASLEQRDPEPTSYLALVGAPPLRFQEAPPPPDLVTRPAAAAPPIPALNPVENSIAAANSASAIHEIAKAEPIINEPKPEITVATPPSAPQHRDIIPDDTHSQVRPEDFLPFFQMPGSASQPGLNVTVPVPRSAPAPAPMPTSSASYTQSK